MIFIHVFGMIFIHIFGMKTKETLLPVSQQNLTLHWMRRTIIVYWQYLQRTSSTIVRKWHHHILEEFKVLLRKVCLFVSVLVWFLWHFYWPKRGFHISCTLIPLTNFFFHAHTVLDNQTKIIQAYIWTKTPKYHRLLLKGLYNDINMPAIFTC